MDQIPLYLKAVLLGIIEGVTEFLPVSSTGHLIVANDLLGLSGASTDTFAIFIQVGAVLAVAWEWRRTLVAGEVPAPRLALLLLVAFMPAAILGFLVHGAIKAHLFSSSVVAWSLIIGAVAIIVIEQSHPTSRLETLESITWRDALGVGLMQCAALIPGVSRAGATILGAMLLGWNRSLATQFSFLLAIPTIAGAAAFDLVKSRDALSLADAPVFAIGFVVSFIVALVVVRWLVTYVREHDFRVFAAWRLVAGGAILALGIGQVA